MGRLRYIPAQVLAGLALRAATADQSAVREESSGCDRCRESAEKFKFNGWAPDLLGYREKAFGR